MGTALFAMVASAVDRAHALWMKGGATGDLEEDRQRQGQANYKVHSPRPRIEKESNGDSDEWKEGLKGCMRSARIMLTINVRVSPEAGLQREVGGQPYM